MHTSVGRYRVKLNEADTTLRLIDGTLVPRLRQIPGFISYYAAVAAPQLLVSVGLFRDRASCDEANQITSEWLDAQATEIVEGPPKLLGGEIRISASA